MIGFGKKLPKKKPRSASPAKGLKEDNKNIKAKPVKEKKSRFSKKKEKEAEVENLSQEELLGIKEPEEKKPTSSVKCFCHLSGQKIVSEDNVGDPTYTKWFMKELKKENLPPIGVTVTNTKYTSELGKEIRIAVESVSDDIPEDIIQEDASMKIEPKEHKNTKRKVEVNIL